MLRFCLCLLLATAALASVDIEHQEAQLYNAIDKIADKIRNIILNGDAANGIPVLDPLTINHWAFSVDEPPVAEVSGALHESTLVGVGAFVLEKSSIKIGVLPPKATISLEVRVPLVTAKGQYSLHGDAHVGRSLDLDLDGDGDFNVVVGDITFGVKVVVNLPKKVKKVDLTLGLFDLDVEITGANTYSDFLNNEAATRIVEWWADNRATLEDKGGDLLKEVIQEVLDEVL